MWKGEASSLPSATTTPSGTAGSPPLGVTARALIDLVWPAAEGATPVSDTSNLSSTRLLAWHSSIADLAPGSIASVTPCIGYNHFISYNSSRGKIEALALQIR